LKKLADENKLNSLERPKQIILTKEPFSIENEILTPTMKLRRSETVKKYQQVVDDIYKPVPKM